MTASDIAGAAEEYRSRCPGASVRANEMMSAHTSFRIGGPAAAFAMPRNEEELIAALSVCRDRGITPLVIGNGTNLLVDDRPLDIFVICTSDIDGAECEEDIVTAGCGVSLSRLASLARDNGLTGLEFAHGIPGSLGGAVFMNAGAYGGEMAQVVAEIKCVGRDGSVISYAAQEADFSYRHSRFEDSGEIVAAVRIALRPGSGEEIQAKMDELAARRKASQPINMPSAGSTFKRPASGFAAAMIDEAGLRGYSIGGAQVSPKHAGFVVNNGGASFADVRAVMEHVQETVYAKFGVMLAPEIRIIYSR